MKKIILALSLLLMIGSTAQAQKIRTSYFIDKSPLNMSMNAAFSPDRGYVNIPVLGSLGTSYTSNSLSVDKLIFSTDSGMVTFLDPSVNATSFLDGLKDQNTLNVDINTSILGGGFWTKDRFGAKKAFWSINIGLNSYTGANLPKTLFEVAKLGTGEDGGTYNINNLKVYNESYIDLSVGYSRQLNEKLSVGGRAKVLLGLAQADMSFDYMNLTAGVDQWQVSSKGNMNLYMQGLSPKLETGADGQYINGFDYNSFGIAGYGFAVDLGASYKLLDKLTISGAINDIGFISWSKSANVNSAAAGDFTFSGFDIPINDEQTSIEDQMDIIEDDFMDLVHFNPTAQTGSTKMIMASFNFGGEYMLVDDKLGFGALYSGRISPIKYQQELTVSTKYSPIWWFTAALSYSFLNSNFDTFGFALNFSPSWINFFVGSDYMFTKVSKEFVPISQTAANFYLGVSVPL